jgi:hypothetical protein
MRSPGRRRAGSAKGRIREGDSLSQRAQSAVTATCPDCGVALPEGGACIDYFHELLVLEANVPGGPGELPHFLAVATYNLQHASGFMPSALLGLRGTLHDVLGGRATLGDARRRARAAADGSTRVRRRPDTVLSDGELELLRAWPTTWSMTVLDVCRVQPEEYVERVRRWAAVTVETLRGAD